jgi:hypothetical protein
LALRLASNAGITHAYAMGGKIRPRNARAATELAVK